jgi:hypothetical protein
MAKGLPTAVLNDAFFVSAGASGVIALPLDRPPDTSASTGSSETLDAAHELLPGASPAMRHLRRQVARIAAHDAFERLGSWRATSVVRRYVEHLQRTTSLRQEAQDVIVLAR